MNICMNELLKARQMREDMKDKLEEKAQNVQEKSDMLADVMAKSFCHKYQAVSNVKA